MIPGVGAVINGGLDFAETKIIADRAYKMFFEGDFSAGEKNEDDDEVIIVEAENIVETEENPSEKS